jgi:hypothetical protein
MTVRTGTFRYVRIERLPEFLARGWMPVAELGRVHGTWSVLCWRCDCAEFEQPANAAHLR